MKKILLITFLGAALFSCSKEELEINNQQIEKVNLHLDNCSTLAGPDNSIDLTPAQIQANYNSLSRLEALFSSMLKTSVRGTGTWSPSISQLAAQYTSSSTKFGSYTSTYTVSNGDCTDSAAITVNVVPECNVNAGPDNSSTVLTVSQVQQNYNSISKLKVLYMSLIGDGISTTGTFNPTIEQIGMAYVNAQDKTGTYSTTYTVGTGNCIDTAELSITVVADPVTDPVCTVDAGPDNSITLTTSQIQSNYNSLSRIEALYNSLLKTSVRGTGIWSPSISQLVSQYTSASVKAGSYTSIYTVTDGDCTDTVAITIIVTQ